MPDLFFDMFARQLTDIRRDLEVSLAEERLHKISKVFSGFRAQIWREIPRSGSDVDLSECFVIAVDGSTRSIELSSGSKIVINRAVAVSNVGAKPLRNLKIRVLEVPSRSAESVTLLDTELETAINALKSIDDKRDTYLLLDGSLYVRLIGMIHGLILTRGFLDLYYVPEVISTLCRLAELLELCRERNVKAIFISKNSHLKIMKEHILFTALRDLIGFVPADLEVFDIIVRGLEWYSVIWLRSYRKKIVDLLKRLSLRGECDAARECIKVILSQSITDVDALECLAREQRISQGVSRRLLVGAVDSYLNVKGLTSVNSLVKLIGKRVSDCLMLRDAERYHEDAVSDYVRRVEQALSRLPRILIMYVKFGKHDAPTLVELPFAKWSFFDDRVPPKVFHDSYDVWNVVNLLKALYRDPYHYNKLLWLAHEYATFTDKQFVEYLTATVKCIREVKGVRMHSVLVN